MTGSVVLNDFVLLDGTGAAPRPGARVVVEDGVITAVDDASADATPGRVIEGRRRWLLPGLWDTHMHHAFSGGGFVSAEEFSEQQGLATWRAYLRNGVTSVVSVADERQTILGARAAEREGALVAPRIFAAGPALTAPGGHPVSTILHGEAARFHDIAVEVADPGAGRRHVRHLVEDDDVDLIKVIYSSLPGGVPRLGRDVLHAVVEEAHDRGRRVFAHVSTVEDASHSIDAGTDGLEHMVLAGGEALAPVFALAAERGMFWTPTLSLFDKMAHDGDPRYIEGYQPQGSVTDTVLRSLEHPRAWWQKPDPGTPVPPWARTVELAGRAHAAGVPIALGTDAGNPAVFHGLAVHRELELLVRAGLSPLEALRSASAVAAEKAGADGTLGTIEVGKEADLAVLRASPLEDIRNTRQVDLVIKRGQVFDAVALRA